MFPPPLVYQIWFLFCIVDTAISRLVDHRIVLVLLVHVPRTPSQPGVCRRTPPPPCIISERPPPSPPHWIYIFLSLLTIVLVSPLRPSLNTPIVMFTVYKLLL